MGRALASPVHICSRRTPAMPAPRRGFLSAFRRVISFTTSPQLRKAEIRKQCAYSSTAQLSVDKIAPHNRKLDTQETRAVIQETASYRPMSYMKFPQARNFAEHNERVYINSVPIRSSKLTQEVKDKTHAHQLSRATNGPVEAYPVRPGLEEIQPELLQGTKEWFDLRKNRITASAFGNALGFWGIRRVELWEEKIGIREPFTGNAATRWGSSQEAAAVEKYKEITGNVVEHLGFKIYRPEDEFLSWLGASPDGLITSIDLYGDRDARSGNQGVLEVKCPHNKGRPDLGSPWDAVPHYYMPQAQGLLEILDRNFMDFYVWTVNGSSVFRIERDTEYWALMFRMMSEFWWGHVVPARFALARGKSIGDVQAFRPVRQHSMTDKIIHFSRELSLKSPLICRETLGH